MANLPRATVILLYHDLSACACYITEICLNFVTLQMTTTTFAPIVQLKDELNISLVLLDSCDSHHNIYLNMMFCDDYMP